jgi:hypothetical protein
VLYIQYLKKTFDLHYKREQDLEVHNDLFDEEEDVLKTHRLVIFKKKEKKSAKPTVKKTSS